MPFFSPSFNKKIQFSCLSSSYFAFFTSLVAVALAYVFGLIFNSIVSFISVVGILFFLSFFSVKQYLQDIHNMRTWYQFKVEYLFQFILNGFSLFLKPFWWNAVDLMHSNQWICYLLDCSTNEVDKLDTNKPHKHLNEISAYLIFISLDKVCNFITFLYDFVFHRNHGFIHNPHDMVLLVIGNVIGGKVYVTKLPFHIWASVATWIDNEPTIRYIDI